MVGIYRVPTVCAPHPFLLIFQCPGEAAIVPIVETGKWRLRKSKLLAQSTQFRNGNAGTETEVSD